MLGVLQENYIRQVFTPLQCIYGLPGLVKNTGSLVLHSLYIIFFQSDSMVLQYLHKSVIIFFKVQSEKLKISETKKRTIFIIITQEQFWPKRKKFSLINHFLINRPFLPTHRNLTSFCWFCRECLCHVQLSVIRARKGLSGRATPYEPNHICI